MPVTTAVRDGDGDVGGTRGATTATAPTTQPADGQQKEDDWRNRCASVFIESMRIMTEENVLSLLESLRVRAATGIRERLANLDMQTSLATALKGALGTQQGITTPRRE